MPSVGAADRAAMRVAATAALAMLVAAVAHADPQAIAAGGAIAANGKGDASACDTCHAGAGVAGSPRLAGLDAAYLAAQLAAYVAGKRQDPKMAAIAKALDAKAAADVSAFYASLPPPASPAAAAPPDAQFEAGARLAQRGDWSVGVPRCAACHGQSGRGVGAAFPAIAGQPASYIAAQLRAWRSGARRDDPQGLMRAVAARLDDAQIMAVSAHCAALPAAPSPGISR